MATKKTSAEQRLYNTNLGQSDTDIAPDMSRGSGKVMKRTDFSDDKTGPNFDVARRASRVDNSDGSKVGPNMGKVNKPKVKAKPSVKKLKDTSGDYYTADGISGDMGSRQMFEEGETAPAFKRGGSVGSASKRADGCAVRGKTRA